MNPRDATPLSQFVRGHTQLGRGIVWHKNNIILAFTHHSRKSLHSSHQQAHVKSEVKYLKLLASGKLPNQGTSPE